MVPFVVFIQEIFSQVSPFATKIPEVQGLPKLSSYKVSSFLELWVVFSKCHMPAVSPISLMIICDTELQMNP